MTLTKSFPASMCWLRVIEQICLLTVLLVATVEAFASGYLVYVGTYTGNGSEGIYAYRFDPATGATSSVGLAAATDNPSFIAVDPNGRFLYAVNELESFDKEPTGAISVFAIDRESGRLKLLQQVSSLGAGKTPRNFVIDPTGKWLLAANQDSNEIRIFQIDQSSGRLIPTSRSIKVISPVCIRVVFFK